MPLRSDAHRSRPRRFGLRSHAAWIELAPTFGAIAAPRYSPLAPFGPGLRYEQSPWSRTNATRPSVVRQRVAKTVYG